jgi:hypothetical protein
LGFRIEDAGASLCYLPDHEPAMIGSITELAPEWLSGYGLAQGVDMLLHDCQYTDTEYPSHYGWGHSAVSHTMQFVSRCEATRALLFHHDPSHSDDDLDAVLGRAGSLWRELGGENGAIAMAADGTEVGVEARAQAATGAELGSQAALQAAEAPGPD